MDNHNSYRCTGFIQQDVEVRYAQSGTAWGTVRVAVMGGTKEKSTTAFVDVKCFGALAEGMKDAKKGDRVCVLGRLQTESWDDKQTGQKRSKLICVADWIEIIEAEKPRKTPAKAEPVTDYGDIPF